MKKLLYKLRYFLAITTIFILIALIPVLCINKLDCHLLLNHQCNAVADVFFKYYTNVGDGAFALVLLPFLLFFGKMKHLLLAIFSCLLGGMLAQLLKRTVFYGAPRPIAFFDENMLHVVDGVHLNHVNTFPSGHTASAFAFFIFLAFVGKKSTTWQCLCAILAILAAYSRVYLSHHFLIDVIGGSFTGIFGFLIAYLLHKRIKSYHLERKTLDWFRFAWQNRTRILSLEKQ